MYIMNKDVNIKIVGTHGNGKDKDTVVTNCSGFYFEKNGSIFIKYTETDSETGAIRNALVKLMDKEVSVEYKGTTDTLMRFEMGKTHNSMYITPLGSMRITVTTSHMEIEKQPDEIRIYLEYFMSFDETELGDPASILIVVTSKY